MTFLFILFFLFLSCRAWSQDSVQRHSSCLRMINPEHMLEFCHHTQGVTSVFTLIPTLTCLEPPQGPKLQSALALFLRKQESERRHVRSSPSALRLGKDELGLATARQETKLVPGRGRGPGTATSTCVCTLHQSCPSQANMCQMDK
jgi:hypothetical protein